MCLWLISPVAFYPSILTRLTPPEYRYMDIYRELHSDLTISYLVLQFRNCKFTSPLLLFVSFHAISRAKKRRINLVLNQRTYTDYQKGCHQVPRYNFLILKFMDSPLKPSYHTRNLISRTPLQCAFSMIYLQHSPADCNNGKWPTKYFGFSLNWSISYMAIYARK